MNNFDKSSSGVNLELNISFDLDRSQREFNESFVILNTGELVFNQYGNFDFSDFSLTDLDNYDLSGCTVKSIFKDYYNFKYPTNIDNDLKATDYTCVKELIMYLDISFNDLDVNGLLEAIETDLYCDNDFAKFLSDNYSKNYVTLVSRGYSQGDYKEIIIPVKVIKDFGGKTADQVGELLQTTIGHMLQDSPLYAILEIDNEEFYIDEHLKDEYQYDQDEIKEILSKHLEHEQKAYIIKWVADNMPSDPAYY